MIAVRAEPRARREGITGLFQGGGGVWLRLAVHEAPEDGRATRAVAQLLARLLGMAPRDVELLRGATTRQKHFLLRGDAERLVAALQACLPPEPGAPGAAAGTQG